MLNLRQKTQIMHDNIAPNFQNAQVFVVKLAKLQCKRQHIRHIKSDRTQKRKRNIKKYDESSVQTT